MANRLFGGLFGAPGRTSGPGEGDDTPVMITRDDVSDFNEDNVLLQPEETIAELREWLRPTDYDDVGGEYRKHLASHLPGTGGWLLSSKAYREWHDGQHDGLMWIKGIPGSGKSVFAANLTSQLAREGVPVLFFFFRQIIDANHSPVAAVRDWLDQILTFSPPLQLKLKRLVDRRTQLESLSFEDLWSHLRAALSHIPRAYCVVDALDEMDRDEHTNTFLKSLVSLSQWRPAELKVIITSRPVPSVETPLRTAKALDIRLEEDKVDVDIVTYVKDRLASASIPVEEHADIQAAVPGRANGLFLYARLAMDAFLRPGAAVRKVLRELPQDLNIMYSDLLREHARRSGVPHETQLFIMQWVTHANRPLRLLEMAEMLSIALEQPKDGQGLKETKELVRAACGPLLEILPDETVSVVHHSLTEFLNGSTREADAHDYPILDFGATHNRLALASLKYLRSGCLDQMERPEIGPLIDRYVSPRNRLSEYWLANSFLRYACSNWHVHVTKAASVGFDQREVNDVLETFLTGDTLLRWAHLALILQKRYDDNPMLIAIRLGLKEYVERLLVKDNGATESEEARAKTRMAMAHAARGGHEDIIKLLLLHGKEMNIPDEEGYTALMHAARGNHRDVVVLLLEAGADPLVKKSPNTLVDEDDCWGSSKKTAYEFACLGGHDEIAVAFLSYFKTAKQVTWAFVQAIGHRRHAVVQKILESGRVDVDANMFNYENSAALFTACEERDPRMIKLLLDAGADPKRLKGIPGMYEATEYVGTSPLHVLASARCYRSPEPTPEATVECFELLLGAGANVHQRGVDDVTPLLISIDAVAARMLLDAGADPNAANRHGQTLLHISDNADIIQLLLEDAKADAKIETRREGLTPLLSALGSSNMGKANLLLRHGAGAREVDREGNGAFHYVVGMDTPSQAPPGFFEQRKLLTAGLLEYGASPSLRNHKGETPLHLLGRPLRGYRGPTSEHHDILETLLRAGASLEEKDDRGQIPLYRMILQYSGWDRYDECVKSCENMAPPGGLRDVADAEGRNLLLGYIFARGNDVRFVKYLVERGVNPTQTDIDGNNLWHAALPFYCSVCFGPNTHNATLFEEFIKMGVGPDQPNRAGRTALHVVSGLLPRPIRSLRCSNQRVQPGEVTVFNYVLGLVENVNHPDEQGVTALHIASTFSEWQTTRLLEAGADARRTTHEGLTALHLAARSRKPNVIGILLDHFRACSTAEEMASVINARDALGRTPLYYACAAGRAATVRLLVEAGAEVRMKAFEGSPWHGCARFEEADEKEGSDINYLRCQNRSDGGPDSGGVTIADDTPPRQPTDFGSWATAKLPLGRLDELLEELERSGGGHAEVIDEAITSAARSGFDYTVGSLLVTRASLHLPDQYATIDPIAAACVERVLGNRGADAEENKAKLRLGYAKQQRDAYRAEGLARRRSPELHKEVLLKKDCLEVDGWGETLINRLISDGNAADLASVLTRDIASKFEDADWCQQHENKMHKTLQPLLFDACECEEPNMDVLRVLVETVGVDVNCRHRAASGLFGRSQSADANGGGILHALVRSQRWWHASQALPYLVRMGADLEIKDNEGLTALGAALESLGTIVFDRRVVEALLELGADPSSVDGKGRSCLASVVGDMELIRLFVRHGAAVTQSALVSAIDDESCEALEALLSGGTDPNVQQKTEEQRRREEAEKPKNPRWSSTFSENDTNGSLTVHEMYPLHYVAHKFSLNETDEAGREACERMARILLDNGADPEAAYEQSTVIHEVLRLNRFPRLFLELPFLNLEARDAAGRTLLLRLCSGGQHVIRCRNQRDPSVSADPDLELRPLMELIRRGADIRARDDAGNSALHHFLNFHHEMSSPYPPHFDREAFDYIMATAPEIVNQASADGSTPLQLALLSLNTRHDMLLEFAEALLDAGADPLARGRFGNTPLRELLAGRWEVSEDGVVVGLRRKLFDRLIAAGADINERNSDGETPIFSFIRGGERLPPKDQQPRAWMRNIEDKIRAPKVEDALEWFERPLFEFWKQMGVDWTVVNDSKESLLHVIAADTLAVHSGGWVRNRQRFEYLMSKGLDELAEDGRHRTAVDIASALDNNIVLGLFEKKKLGAVRAGADELDFL